MHKYRKYIRNISIVANMDFINLQLSWKECSIGGQRKRHISRQTNFSLRLWQSGRFGHKTRARRVWRFTADSLRIIVGEPRAEWSQANIRSLLYLGRKDFFHNFDTKDLLFNYCWRKVKEIFERVLWKIERTCECIHLVSNLFLI